MERTQDGRIKVYDLETGTVREHWPVDGRDIIIAGAGRYSFEKPVEGEAPAPPVYSGSEKDIKAQFMKEVLDAGYEPHVAVTIVDERWAVHLASLRLPPSPALSKTVEVPINPVAAKAEATLEEVKAIGEIAPGVPLIAVDAGGVVRAPEPISVDPSL